MRRSRLRSVSRKRARENARRRQLKSRVPPGEPCSVYVARMIAVLPPLAGCTRLAQDMNEIRSRARGGSITDPGNVNLPCRPCHDYLTDHPDEEWVRQLGLARHSWEWEDEWNWPR